MTNSPSRPVRRVVTIVGARPQFIKAFALSRVLTAENRFEEVMVHTGQHFDRNMSDIFFAELGIERPRYFLNIHGGNHGEMTGRMLAGIEEILVAERPDALIAYGDTNSTLAGALAAAKLHVPVVHIEAGLRSFNRRSPEEINRIVVDHLSSLLLCPTSHSMENLRREGITNGVHCVGDLMFDAAAIAGPLAARHSTILRRLGLEPKRYGVATLHRAENIEDKACLAQLVRYIGEEAGRRPLIVPLHPRTAGVLAAASIAFESDAITVIEPVGYLDMCQLVHSAEIVLTDSGGLQREAYFHRVPCVTLRNETEWIETIDCGWNRLWTMPSYRPRREISEYGNAHSAATILGVLDRNLPG